MRTAESCVFETKLWPLCEGALSSEEGAKLHRHIQQCQVCQRGHKTVASSFIRLQKKIPGHILSAHSREQVAEKMLHLFEQSVGTELTAHHLGLTRNVRPFLLGLGRVIFAASMVKYYVLAFILGLLLKQLLSVH